MRFSEHYLAEDNKIIAYHGTNQDFDKFDMSKVGTGEELSKYGYGLYFTKDKELAEYYANYLAVGDKTPYIYEVKLWDLEYYHDWDGNTPMDIFECVLDKLRDMDKEQDADEMKQEYEDYNEFTISSLYSFLTHILGGEKETTEFLYDCGLSGVFTDVAVQQVRGKVYVAYSDRVKIVRKYKMGEEEQYE